VGGEEPWIRLARTTNGYGVDRVYLRIEVRNTGRTAARGVALRIVRWWLRKEDANYEWTEEDMDPALLHPVSAPPDAMLSDGTITIAAKSFDFFDIASCAIRQGRCRLEVHDPRPRGVAWESHDAFLEQRFEVVVQAENVEPITRVVRVRFSQERWLEYVEPSQVPPPTATLRIGLANIFTAGGVAGPPRLPKQL
jgi:hypothetical protein